MAKKFYAIRKGRQTGVFSGQWKEIEKKYIKGFSNPEYKGFNNREQAEEYLRPKQQVDKKKEKKEIREPQVKIKEKKVNKSQQVANERVLLTQKIIYSEKNPEHVNMTTVSVALLGHQSVRDESKSGYYDYILKHEESGRKIKVTSERTPHTSPSRAIAQGLIDAISKLRKPCHIKVYLKIYVGFKKMIRGSKSPNAELLKELKNLILEKGHVIEEIFDIDKTNSIFEEEKNLP